MNRYRFTSLALLFAIAAIVPLGCFAQPVPVPGGITSGSITLEIVDGGGSPIPGATIEAREESTGRVFSVVTDASGQVRIPQVPVGTYEVRASLEGFETATKNVTVAVGQSSTVRFVLGGPVPGGIGNGASSGGGGGGGGGGAPVASPSPVVEVVTSSTDDDVVLQQLLTDRAAAGWSLASTVAIANRSTLLVFYKSPEAAACVAQVVTRPLTAADLEKRLAQQPKKRFRGIHRFSANSFAIVLCEE